MKHRQKHFCSNVKIMLVVPVSTNFEIKDCDLIHETQKNIIIRTGEYTITRYRNSLNRYHITGIYNFEKISELVVFLSERMCIPYHIITKNYVVNNSSWHIDLKESINLKKLAEKLIIWNSNNFTWKFNTLKFPGLCIKWDEGCGILFNSGKINILGIRSKPCFYRIKIKILDILYCDSYNNI